MSPSTTSSEDSKRMNRAWRAPIMTCAVLAVTTVIGGWAYYRDGIPEYVLPDRPHLAGTRAAQPARGPLRVLASNPRYFTDGGGRAVALAGAHTWSNFQDNGIGDPPPRFDYEAFLDFLVAHRLNFFRLWAWEQARWAPWVTADDYFFFPGPPYERTGPGVALDGKPRFDLDRYNPAYFERLRDRVARAGERGIYVSVMLFNGWAIDNEHSQLRRGNAWRGHPYNRANNVNGIDGDPNQNDGGEETHQLLIPEVTARQDEYVRRVIDAVNEFDNVLFEVSNESYASSRDWQYHIIELVHRYEAGKAKQHPVGMSQYQWPGNNADLFSGPADWVAPWEELPEYPYRNDPRPSDGRKVVIVDTDHLWGIGGDRRWAWKSFLRGNNPTFMDGYDGASVGCGAPAPWDIRLAGWKDIVKDVLRLQPRPEGWNPNAERWVSLRANMGYILDFARRINLAQMKPQPKLCSTGYCLARTNTSSAEYLIYAEDSKQEIEIDLTNFPGELRQEWFDPASARTVNGAVVRGGARRRFESPFRGDAVLYLHSAESPRTARGQRQQ